MKKGKTTFPSNISLFLYTHTHRLANPESRDMFGMIISYTVKVKLYLGAVGGEVTAELPFVLMHPKVSQFASE